MTRHFIIVSGIMLYFSVIQSIIIYYWTDNPLALIISIIGLLFCVTTWFTNFEKDFEFPDYIEYENVNESNRDYVVYIKKLCSRISKKFQT